MRRFVTVTAIFLSLLVVAGGASAQGTLRIGMTASDVPYTGGQTDNGFEGFRFVGYQVYEPLIAWDLTRGDRLPPLVPGLAESWEVRKDQPTKCAPHPVPVAALRSSSIARNVSTPSTSGSRRLSGWR